MVRVFQQQDIPRWLVVLSVLLGTITVSLNNSALNPAVPEFMHVFGVGPISASWIVAAFMISMGMTMPLTGYLSQKFGNRPMYLLGLMLFIVGSLLGACANSMWSVIFARCVQGISSGLMIPLSLALIFSVYPKNERGRVTGLWGAAVMLAPAVGPLIGGILLELSSWRMLFVMNIPIGIIGLIFGLKALPKEQPSQDVSFDWLGFICITFGLGLLMFSLSQIRTLDALIDPMNALFLMISALFLLLFIIVELSKQQPLLNLRVFKIKSYSFSVVIAVAQAVGMFECLVLLPLFVQMVLGYSPIWTGLALLCTAVSASWFVNLGGKTLDRYGPRGIVTIGVFISGIATLSLGSVNNHASIWLIMSLMIARGIGIGLSYMPVTTAGLNAIPEQFIAQGAAMNNILRRVFSSVAIIIVAVYLEVRSHQITILGTSHSFAMHTAISEAFLATGLFILLTLPFAFFFPLSSEEEGFASMSSEQTN
ncbi:DHA2 family efflux MFS transporter permease subunit [Acinetobacter sp. ESBL14]|uniref:DHA2 family efflux MFS transporter permease subunit n=1 Tax=Acinetobacter sp. ESBL14 TaxID=3077329 RepID=UPI002FC79EC0